MMKLSTIAILTFAAAVTFFAAGPAQSDSYPTGPIKVVVPYLPGGSGDIIARTLGKKVGEEFGQSIVVENKSGANGIVGADVVAHAKPDGYTLLQMATSHVILPLIKENIPYDIYKDFVPVFGISKVPLVFAVNGKSNIKSINDLVAISRSQKGGINYSSGGIGSISHLAAANLIEDLGITGTHIPVRGFSAAVQALLGDQVQFICVSTADVTSLAKANAVRVLAVTDEHRVPLLPDVPTMAELGFKNFNAASWNAYLAPKDTPKAVIDRLFKAYTQAAEDPGAKAVLSRLGVEMDPLSEADLASFMQNEGKKWQRVIEANHIHM